MKKEIMKKIKNTFYDISEILITEIIYNNKNKSLYKANIFNLKPYIIYDTDKIKELDDEEKLLLFNLTKPYLLTKDKNDIEIGILSSDKIENNISFIDSIYETYKLFNWYIIENIMPFLLIDYLLKEDNTLMLIGLTFFKDGVNIITVNPQSINIEFDYKNYKETLFKTKSDLIKFMMKKDLVNTFRLYDTILYKGEKYIDNEHEIKKLLG